VRERGRDERDERVRACKLGRRRRKKKKYNDLTSRGAMYISSNGEGAL